MKNTWIFEDAKAFKRVDKKFDERFIKDRKNSIENEASLLELALDVSNLYEYKIKYEKECYLKPIRLWLNWKNRETFQKKFKKHFNLGDNLHNETKNFTKIYLEYEDDVFVRVDGAYFYPSCFANRYIRVKGDNEYRFNKNETGVYVTSLHYLWLVFK